MIDLHTGEILAEAPHPYESSKKASPLCAELMRSTKSHPKLEAQVALAMLREGFSESEIEVFFEMHLPVYYDSIGKAKWKKSIFQRAKFVYEASDYSEHLRWAKQNLGSGRAGASEYLVYAALCELSRRTGRMPIGASTRELAELTGLTHKTCAQALTRLGAKGCLRAFRSGAGKSKRFHLLMPNWGSKSGNNYYSPKDGNQIVVKIAASHPAFAAKVALGKSCFRVLECMLQGEATWTTKTMSAATKKCARTIRSCWKELVRHDLVLHEGRTYRLKDGWEAQLDRIATLYGTTAMPSKRRKQHRAQRESYQQYLAAKDLAARTCPDTPEFETGRRAAEAPAEAPQRTGEPGQAITSVPSKSRTTAHSMRCPKPTASANS